MISKKSLNLTLLLLIIPLLACDTGDLIAAFTTPTVTPTFVMARFATATSTPVAELLPTETATPAPVETVTPTAEAVAVAETPASNGDAEANSDSPPATPTPADTPTPAATATPTATPLPPTATPTDTPVPTPAPLAGRIAFPIDNGGGRYDVWVIDLPDGDPFTIQNGARQPNFSNGGRLLVNLENNQYGEHLGLFDANYVWQGQVSDSPHDAYPYWNPEGELYVYSNPQRLLDPITNDPLSHVFMPCSLRPPWEEDREKCRDIPTFGKVAIGQAPVWTEDGRVAYFSFEGDDGIYVVSGVAGLWEAGGVGSRQLLVTGNAWPTDSHGFQVFFHAGNIDQNWEAYAIDLDGSNLTNLTNSPDSQEGLPTVSPDGSWVAFVSDRDGKWGIWAMPRLGGEMVKLVDYANINPNPNPWGINDRAWFTERLSWGP